MAAHTYTAKKIRRRVRTIKLLKLLLPTIAIVLLATVLLWPNINKYFAPAPQTIQAVVNTIETPIDENTAIKPQYEGVDSKGQIYKLTAQTGTNIAPGIINLEYPMAEQSLKTGHKIVVSALKGTVFQDEKRLELVGSVTFNHSIGIDFTTKSATLLYNEGKAEGNEPTYGVGQGFNIKAGGFRVYDNGEHVVFHKKPILTVER